MVSFPQIGSHSELSEVFGTKTTLRKTQFRLRDFQIFRLALLSFLF